MAKFWQDLGFMSSMDLTDKLLVGKNADGSTQYTDLQTVYNKISQVYFADTKPSVIAAGSVLTNPNSLTCYIAPAGTYTLPSGNVTLTGNINFLFWDFSAGWTYQSFDVGVKDNTVTTSKIADGAVTTQKIANQAVDSTKIEPKSLKKNNLNALARINFEDNAIDNQIGFAIKYIYLELEGYADKEIAIRLLGYSAGQGLYMQLYNATDSETLYTITLNSLAANKPNTVEKYQQHIENKHFIQITIDWGSFTGSLLQSSAFTAKIDKLPYNRNRTALGQNFNGIGKGYLVNGIDEKQAFAIKYLKFESITNESWAIAQLGWNGVDKTNLVLRSLTSNSNYVVLLEASNSKPSGVKTYRFNDNYARFVEIVVDWDSFSATNLISTTYSVSVVSFPYDSGNSALQQVWTGVKSFAVNSIDEDIALAIKKITFENILTDEFAISRIGYIDTTTRLTLELKNLNTLATTVYKLDSTVTAKPTGIIEYTLQNKGVDYINVVIDWNSFAGNAMSSSALTVKPLVSPLNPNRNNRLSSFDESQEAIKINSPYKIVSGTIDLTKVLVEQGSVSAGQDLSNTNRIRTKYSIAVKGSSTVTVTVAAGYRLIVVEVITTGVKTYTYVKESGWLTGTNTITLDAKTDSIRLIFSAVPSGAEVKINETEIINTNFSLNLESRIVDNINNANKFVDGGVMWNNFVREMYIEGLASTDTIEYKIFYVQRNVGGLNKLYIYRRSTNTSVFAYAPTASEFSEKGIFDIKLGNVRVRALLDWSAIPNGYNVSGLDIPLTQKCYDINYSPSIKSAYQNTEQYINRLIPLQGISSVDNNYLANSVNIFERNVVGLMNSRKASEIKASTQTVYDALTYEKNGSVGIGIGQFFFEFCNEKDGNVYDVDSNVFVRKIDLTTKSMVSKIRIIGYGDTVLGEAMTRVPYVYSGVQIGSVIRIYIQLHLVSSVKNGFIDFDTTSNTFTSFQLCTLNSLEYSYDTYYSYLKSIDSTLYTGKTFGDTRDMSRARHIAYSGGYYYSVIGLNVGILPYDGATHSLVRSSNGIDWTIIYVFNDRSGQDDGDIFEKDGLLYIQLRQSAGNLFSTIVVWDIANNRVLAKQNIKVSRSRAEFFSYNSNIYMLGNIDENRQYAVLYQLKYENQGLEITPIVNVEGWVSNWSIYAYNGIVYVFFGTKVWEFKFDYYTNNVADTLYNLLK